VKIFVATLSFVIVSAPAFAGDNGFYAGMNLGIGKPDINTPNGTSKDSSVVAGGVVGYKFNKYFAVESQYTGIGRVTDKVNGSAKGDAISLSGLGILPLTDNFDLYGKLGLAVAKTSVSGGLASMSDATRTAMTYGVGAQYNVNQNIGLRLGWDRYNAAIDVAGNNKNNNADVISVGALYSF
jgi:OOP family OmpA-OmpF porin